MALWRDLVDNRGFRGRYNSVRRFVCKQRGITALEARVVIETTPGEEAQIDNGEGSMVRDPNTGKYCRMGNEDRPSSGCASCRTPPPRICWKSSCAVTNAPARH